MDRYNLLDTQLGAAQKKGCEERLLEHITSEYFDYMQIDEILAAHSNGIAVDKIIQIIAHPIFNAHQMNLIRYGLEKKWLANIVMMYAKSEPPIFSSEQMQQIIYAIEQEVPIDLIQRFADPDVPAMIMSMMRNEMVLKEKDEIIESFVKEIEYEKETKKTEKIKTKDIVDDLSGFDRNQLTLIKNAEKILDEEQMHILVNVNFDEKQMQQILWGFDQSGLTIEQVKYYAREEYSGEQMNAIRLGLKSGLTYKQIGLYSNSKLSAAHMQNIYRALNDKNPLPETWLQFALESSLPAGEINTLKMMYQQGYSLTEVQEDYCNN